MLSRIFGKKNIPVKKTAATPPPAPAPAAAQINSSFLFAVQSHNLDAAKKWAAQGADINTAEDGHTPALISGLRDKKPDITDWLLTQNPDLELEDRLGKTALMTAVDNGADWVDKIVKAGARLDTKNSNGWTALEYALRHNHVDSAGTLIDAAENLDAPFSDGSTAADYARRNGLKEVVDKIAQKDRAKTAAVEAAHKPETQQPVSVMKTIRFKKSCVKKDGLNA